MGSTGGYLSEKTRSPASLGAAVAINGAMVGALLFLSPNVEKLAPKIFETIFVSPTKLTENPPPPPKAETLQMQPRSVRTVSTPPVTPVDAGNITPRDDYVKTFPTDPAGTGMGPITETPVHKSVFVGTKVDSRFARQMQPDYPAGLQRRGVEGMVEVRVLVGPDGRVKDIQMVSATDPDFYDATAQHAMRRWRFQPATRDGVAVEAWRTMTVRFRLDGNH